MRRPGFAEGVLVALVLSIAGAVAAATLPVLLGVTAGLKMLVAALAAAYGVYLLRRSSERTGRLVMPCVWLAVTVAGWLLLSLPAFVVLQTTLLWLIRALHFHGGPLAAMADLGLSAFALGAAVWALGSGSWLLAIWSFFLTQSLFAWIPSPADPERCAPDHDDGFEQARELAQTALERLATHR